MKDVITIKVGGKDEFKSFDAVTAHFKALAQAETLVPAPISLNIIPASEVTSLVTVVAGNMVPPRKSVSQTRAIVLVSVGCLASEIAISKTTKGQGTKLPPSNILPLGNILPPKKPWGAKV